jgi:hypothetical protein
MEKLTRAVALASGLIGVGAYLTGVLPALPNSILVGSSAGLVLAGLFIEKLPLPSGAAGRAHQVREPEPESVRWARTVPTMVEKSMRRRRQVAEAALARFDEVIARFDGGHSEKASELVTDAVSQMNTQYNEYEGEGRIRIYVLLQQMAETLSPKNAEAYMETAMKILKLRPNEGAEYSRELLGEKVQRMYFDPRNDQSKFIVGTLMLMNRGDGDYIKNIVADAIHLWSDYRFDNLLADFSVVALLPSEQRLEILDMAEKEIRKARKAGDVSAVLRAREIMDLVISQRPAHS